MDDAEILSQIHNLVEEEKKLRADHRGSGLRGEDRGRLEQLEEQLDQRLGPAAPAPGPRGVRREPGRCQGAPTNEVEGYLQ